MACLNATPLQSRARSLDAYLQPLIPQIKQARSRREQARELSINLFVRTVLLQNICPLVVVHPQRVGQRPVLALVQRVHIGALVDK